MRGISCLSTELYTDGSSIIEIVHTHCSLRNIANAIAKVYTVVRQTVDSSSSRLVVSTDQLFQSLSTLTPFSSFAVQDSVSVGDRQILCQHSLTYTLCVRWTSAVSAGAYTVGHTDTDNDLI